MRAVGLLTLVGAYGCAAVPLPDVLPPLVEPPPVAVEALPPAPLPSQWPRSRPPMTPPPEAVALCGPGTETFQPGSPATPSAWEVFAVCRDGRPVAYDPARGDAGLRAVRFERADGAPMLSVQGDSSCNGFFGEVSVGGGHYDGAGVSTTFQACPEPFATVETGLYAALGGAGTTATLARGDAAFWRLDPSERSLNTRGYSVVLRQRPDLLEPADCSRSTALRARTLRPAYALGDTADVVLDNCAARRLTYTPCGGWEGVHAYGSIERRADSGWEVAAANACGGSETRWLPPGGRLRLRAVVSARELAAPGLDLSGRYRIQWGNAVGNGEPRFVPIESVPFEVRDGR